MKFSNLIKYAIVTVAMVLSTNLVNDTSAQNASSIEELMREDVIAVAAADLAKVDLVQVLKWSSETGIVSTEEAADIRIQLRAAQGVIGGLMIAAWNVCRYCCESMTWKPTIQSGWLR